MQNKDKCSILPPRELVWHSIFAKPAAFKADARTGLRAWWNWRWYRWRHGRIV